MLITILHIDEGGTIHSWPASGLARWGGVDNCGNDCESEDD